MEFGQHFMKKIKAGARARPARREAWRIHVDTPSKTR